MFALRCYLLAAGAYIALIATGVSNRAQAAEAIPLPIEAAVDSVSTEAYGPVAVISPDGTLAAFSVATAHVHQLRLLSLKDSISRTLTELTDDASAPAWSADGRALAFFMRRGGHYGLWVWRMESGEMKQVSQVALTQAPPWLRPVWTPDGRSIIVALGTGNGVMTEDYGPPTPERVRVFKAHRPNSAPRLPSERPPASNGIGLVDVAIGQVRKLSSGEIDSYQLDPSGTRLAVLERLPRHNPNAFEIFNRLSVIELSSGESKVLSNTVTTVYGKITWSPDGRYLGWVQDYPPEMGTAYLASVADGTVRKIKGEPEASFAAQPYAGRPLLWDGDAKRFFIVADGQLWVGTPEEAVARRLTKGSEWEISELVPGVMQGSAASSDAYRSVVATVVKRTEVQEGFSRINLRSGALSLLVAGDVRVADGINKPVVLPDGKRVLYTAQAADQPQAIWLSKLDFRAPRRLALLNPALANRTFGTSRLVSWKNARGDALQGVLLLPADCPSCRHPLVVDVYAEPGVARLKNFFGVTPDGGGQIYASRGYAIFVPDTRLRIGTPIADLLDDVLSGLDAVLQTGIIDPQRVAVMGHSYGGYNVLALISHSERFQAAVSAAGFADLISGIYGNPGRGTLSPGWAEGEQQGRMGGSPWEFPQRYLDNSPLWKLDRVRTPLLLIHGTEDDTVPVFTSTMVFNAMQRLGHEVEYVQYLREGHALTQRYNRIDEYSRKLAWLDEHLNLVRDAQGRLLFDGQSASWRRAPAPLSGK